MKMVNDLGRGFVRRKPERVTLDMKAEVGRIAQVKAAAPSGLPFGPGRGPVQLVNDWQGQPGGTRRLVGRHYEEADVFTRMCRAAILRHERLGLEHDVVLPLTWGQIGTGRDYRTVTERHAAGGVKCVSWDRAKGGGGDFMDAHLALGRKLHGYHAAIGQGSALVLRRIRPSVRGARSGITDRALVDAVCLKGMMPGAVLKAHGWSDDGKHRAAVMAALVGALDRMQGYRA